MDKVADLASRARFNDTISWSSLELVKPVPSFTLDFSALFLGSVIAVSLCIRASFTRIDNALSSHNGALPILMGFGKRPCCTHAKTVLGRMFK